MWRISPTTSWSCRTGAGHEVVGRGSAGVLRRLEGQRDPGESRPEAVVQIASKPAALLLASGHDLSTRDLELRRERDRVERERELRAQDLDERDIVGRIWLARRPGADDDAPERPAAVAELPLECRLRGRAADLDRSEAQPAFRLEQHARGAERFCRRVDSASTDFPATAGSFGPKYRGGDFDGLVLN